MKLNYEIMTVLISRLLAFLTIPVAPSNNRLRNLKNFYYSKNVLTVKI